MKTLKDALAKKEADLSASEKTLIAENWDLLNDDIRKNFESCAPVEEKTIDKAGLKKLIEEGAGETFEKSMDEIAHSLVSKFKTAMDKSRIEVGAEGSKSKSDIQKENDEITRKFLNALRNNDTETLKKLGQKAMDTTSDGSGSDVGFTIPQVLANEVIRISTAGSYGKARNLFAYHLITEGNSKRISALGSTLSVFWADEGEKKPASTFKFKLVELTLKKLVVIVPMTEEAVEDSGINLTELTATLIREAIDKEVDTQFFNGDGTVWTGIFNDSSIPKIELAATKTIANLAPSDIIGMVDAVAESVNGRYIGHRSVLSKIRGLRENTDGTGAYLYNPLAADESSFGTLNGRPFDLIEAAPTATSASVAGNKPFLMYGDFKGGVAYGEKSDVKLKLLDQATITDEDGETVINLAEQDMIGIRAVQRVGMKVTLPTAMVRLVTGD